MRIHRVLPLAAIVAGGLLLALSGPAASQPSDQDTTWMAAAHQSNLAEIAAGNAALQQATTQEVRSLAQMFVDMHTQLDADLTTAAQSLGVTLPAAPTPEQDAQLAAVQANTGAAFDSAWLAQQLAAHQATAAATQTEIDQGSDPTVVALANAASPVIAQHITELENAGAGGAAPATVAAGSGGQAASLPGRLWPISVAAGVVLVLAGILVLGRSRTPA